MGSTRESATQQTFSIPGFLDDRNARLFFGNAGTVVGNDNMVVVVDDATVLIVNCESGVENQSVGGGATFSDLLESYLVRARIHGAFVSKVSKLANEWKKGGLISGKEKGKITSCAAWSDIP